MAILVLAAAHPENPLRGMGQWAKECAEILLNFPPLDWWSNHDFPSYGTFWYLLTKLGVGELEQALRGWGVGRSAWRWTEKSCGGASGQEKQRYAWWGWLGMGENQLPGRKIGYALSQIRNAALNLLRTLDAPYIPDARRHLAARLWVSHIFVRLLKSLALDKKKNGV